MHTWNAGLAQDATRRLDKAICIGCIMVRDLRDKLTGLSFPISSDASGLGQCLMGSLDCSHHTRCISRPLITCKYFLRNQVLAAENFATFREWLAIFCELEIVTRKVLTTL